MVDAIGKLLLTVAVLLAALPLRAQQYVELDEFQKASSGDAALFRGAEATKYNILYNGTYFWESTRFREGDILFKGRLYRHVYLNIDAARQQVLLSSSINSPQIELKTSDVDYITMEGVRYDNLRNQGFSDMPEGFFELLHSGNVRLYKRVDKSLRSSFENTNGKAFIGYSDPLYKNNIYDYFYFQPSFYCVDENSVVTKIKTKGQAMKLFGGKRSDFKKYLSGRFPSESPDLEGYCMALIEFTER